MSVIYSIATSLSKFFENQFRKSLFFTIIFEIGKFIENQWLNSYFKRFYPNEEFLGILKRTTIIRSKIFAPGVVLLVFAIFLILSINSVSVDLQINLAIAFIAFFIGMLLAQKYFFNEKSKFIHFNRQDIYSIGFCLFLISIIFFLLSIVSVGGIPLLKPSLRYGLKPILTMPVFLMIPAVGLIASEYLNRFKENSISRSQVRFRFLLLIGISSFFLFSLGYRTPIIAVILIMIIVGYYGKVLAVWGVVIGALIGIAIIIGIGYFRSLEEFMITTNTSPFYTLQSRADFTLHVLNLLNYISGDFGLKHGALTLSAIPGTSDLGPRMTIGELIAWRTEVTVTPTLIGPMLVDFGRFGMAIAMGLLGFLLGIGYKILKITKNSFYIALYAILLTCTILGIETGILDIQAIIYFLLGSLIYLFNIKRNLNIKKN